MVLIWGWGNQFRKVADAGISKCNNCHNYSTFEIRELAKNFRLYFVPVAKWGRRYFLVCSTCEAAYEIDSDNLNQFLSEVSEIPYNRTSLEIWNSIDSIVSKMLRDNQMDNWGDKVFNALISEGYKEKEIKYVLSIYLNSISDSVADKQEVDNQENNSNKFSNADYIFCTYCGTKLPANSKYCKQCGKKVMED